MSRCQCCPGESWTGIGNEQTKDETPQKWLKNHTYPHWVTWVMAANTAYQWVQNKLFNKWWQDKWSSIWRERQWNLYLTQFKQINVRWIKDLHIKLLECRKRWDLVSKHTKMLTLKSWIIQLPENVSFSISKDTIMEN